MIALVVKLAIFALNAYVAYWIYTDAQKRGMNAVLWAVLSFFTCPIATVIYFIMRKPG